MQLGSSSSTPGTMESSIRSDINVTPLVDVCLVLLIIFMVVTPMLQEGVPIRLPETEDPAKMPESERQLEVAIKADGAVFINDNWVPEKDLAGALSGIHAQSPNKVVVLKADKALKYKQVRTVMRRINEAGFSGLGLVTERREQAGGSGG